MKAAVCYEFGKPLAIDQVAIDAPQAGEVRVDVQAVAICHSDIHLIDGDWFGRLPMVAGHEAAGIVESVGPGVEDVQPGERVVVSLLRSCGRCRACQAGAAHMCEDRHRLAPYDRLTTLDGRPVAAGLGVGGFAEQVVVHRSQVVPVPDTLAWETACLLACGVITGVGAVLNTARVRPGESVVVVGCGGVGLNTIQGAALSGAYPVVALDLLPTKLEAAKAFGATHTVLAADPDMATKAVRDLTEDRGADAAFVTVGAAAAAKQALGLVADRGSVILVGIPKWTETLPLPMAACVARELKLVGSMMGSACLATDVPKLVKLYEAGRLKLDELVTGRYTLDDINEAVASTRSGAALRNVIVL